jgi:hypothetical protein
MAPNGHARTHSVHPVHLLRITVIDAIDFAFFFTYDLQLTTYD